MKFAHISDSHLGGWRQPELQALNLESFRKVIDTCIAEEVNFVLFTGDLFDTPFPQIEILKETFHEFRRLKDKAIKCYIIAGSHDYSVSGKTFLEVLEKAGFCEISKSEEEEGKIVLKPIIHEGYYIYGYPGKKSGLEVDDLKKIIIKESYSNNFRILMLHTTIKEAAEDIPVESISLNDLPKADYYALGHIHVDFEKEINNKPAIYGGPTFPNNFKELEELKYGSFYIINIEGYTKIIKKEIKLKEVELVELEITNAIRATEKILEHLQRRDLKDKIVLLKIFGDLKEGKPSDIKFSDIESFIKKSGAYSFLKNISKLELEKKDFSNEFFNQDMERIEEVLIKRYNKENPSKFNEYIMPLIEALDLEKQEGEKNDIFNNRLLSEVNKVLDVEL
ncbi:MAG: metallophosphoesterase [Nanoarchaeota archaeon]|nr:metallophosphoesterase [Nanoarchaeota archaeon]